MCERSAKAKMKVHWKEYLMDCFNFTIDSLGGMCPVQATGNIGNQKWYFRARHQGWQFGVGDTDSKAVEATCHENGFCLHGEWGDSTYGAGYMPTADVLELITKCVRQWAASQQQIKVCDEDELRKL